MDLSIIIPTMNNKDVLEKCLKSIYQGTQDVSLEVFVSDNDSTDGTPSMLHTCFSQVKCLENHANLGFAKANNKAIKKSIGRYILLLNDDTVILANALDKMVRFMDEHPKCGIAGCRLVYPNGDGQTCKFSFPSLLKEFYHAYPILERMVRNNKIGKKIVKKLSGTACLKNVFFSYSDYDGVEEVDDVLGAFFMIRKELIDEIGLLDEKYWMCREETDFSYRAKKEGWTVMYHGGIKVIHIGSSTFVRSKKSWIMRYSQNCISVNYFFKKHYSMIRCLLLKAILYPAVALKIFISFIRLLCFSEKQLSLHAIKSYIHVLRCIFYDDVTRAL